MKHPIHRLLLSVIVLFITFQQLSANFDVYHNSEWKNGLCATDLIVFYSGDAGPFELEVSHNNDIIFNRSNLSGHIWEFNLSTSGLIRVILTDRFGCVTETVIEAECGCQDLESVVDQPTCGGYADGQIELILPIGATINSIHWSRDGRYESRYDDRLLIDYLKEAVYIADIDIEVSNSDGTRTNCIIEQSFTLLFCEILICPVITAGQIIDNVCPFEERGSIKLSPEGGVGPYYYRWSHDAAGGSTRYNLLPGFYEVRIRDTYGAQYDCASYFTFEVMEVEENIEYEIREINPNASAGVPAQYEITVTGNYPPFSISGQDVPTVIIEDSGGSAIIDLECRIYDSNPIDGTFTRYINVRNSMECGMCEYSYECIELEFNCCNGEDGHVGPNSWTYPEGKGSNSCSEELLKLGFYGFNGQLPINLELYLINSPFLEPGDIVENYTITDHHINSGQTFPIEIPKAGKYLITATDACGNQEQQILDTCEACDYAYDDENFYIVEGLRLQLDCFCGGFGCGLFESAEVDIEENWDQLNEELLPIIIEWPDGRITTLTKDKKREGPGIFSIGDYINDFLGGSDEPFEFIVRVERADGCIMEVLMEYKGTFDRPAFVNVSPGDFLAIGNFTFFNIPEPEPEPNCYYYLQMICSECESNPLESNDREYIDKEWCDGELYNPFSNDFRYQMTYIPNDDDNPCSGGGDMILLGYNAIGDVKEISLPIPANVALDRYDNYVGRFSQDNSQICTIGGVCVFDALDVINQEMTCDFAIAFCLETEENENIDGDPCPNECDNDPTVYSCDCCTDVSSSCCDECWTPNDDDEDDDNDNPTGSGICGKLISASIPPNTGECIRPLSVKSSVKAGTEIFMDIVELSNGNKIEVLLDGDPIPIMWYQGSCPSNGFNGVTRYTVQNDGLLEVKMYNVCQDTDSDCRENKAAARFTCISPGDLKDPEGCDTELASAKPNDPKEITFNASVADNQLPAFMLGPLSGNDMEPATVRIADISSSEAKIYIDEWGPTDKIHSIEKVSYQYIPEGNYDLDGISAKFKNVESISTAYRWIYFDQPFKSVPIISVTVISQNNRNPVTTRISSVSKTRFRVKIQGEELSNTLLQPETISYSAFTAGQGKIGDRKIVVGKTGRSFNHTWKQLDFNTFGTEGTPFKQGSTPQFFAFMQSTIGSDPAFLRYRNLTNNSVQVMVQEEASKDKEVAHTTEYLGYILIESSDGCCDEESIILNSIVQQRTCDENNGSVYVEAGGDHPPYTYTWSNQEVGDYIDELGLGDYTVTVTDNNGCTHTELFEISGSNDYLGLDHSRIIHPTCIQAGRIDVHVYGGDSPYSYHWHNGASGSLLTNLASGTYSVTVSDSGNCTGEMEFELSEVDLNEEYEIINPACGADNGAITGAAFGGKSPYSYSWSNNKTTSSIYDLSPGPYTLTVTDAHNCKRIRTFNLVNDNNISLGGSGGDEGFNDGRFMEAGTNIQWFFDPVDVSDHLIISSSTDGELINTGSVTNLSSCSCTSHKCDCSDLFLGDYPNSTINLISGVGETGNGSGSCSSGSGYKKVNGISGTFLVANDGYITVEVIGSSCGSRGTAWSLNLSCGVTKNFYKNIEKWRAESFNFQKEDIEFESIEIRDISFGNKQKVKFYPNPSNGIVNIIFPDNYNTNLCKLKVLNLDNKLVYKKTSLSNKEQVDLSNLPKGVYIISVEIEEGQRVIERLIVN